MKRKEIGSGRDTVKERKRGEEKKRRRDRKEILIIDIQRMSSKKKAMEVFETQRYEDDKHSTREKERCTYSHEVS